MDIKQIASILIREFNKSENKYNLSDTLSSKFKIDLSTPEGSFLGLSLGIMYAFPILPKYAENVVQYLISQNKTYLFNPTLLSEVYERIKDEPYNKKLNDLPKQLPEQFNIIRNNYHRIPKLILLNITKAGWFVTKELNGDFSNLYKKMNFDGKNTIKKMQEWKVRLNIKAFWVAREMRIQKVWVDDNGNPISGEFCCVVDKQVQRALKCLGFYREDEDLFYHSKLIWEAFGEFYDIPLLWLAREFCSKKKKYFCPIFGKCKNKEKISKNIFDFGGSGKWKFIIK